MGHRCYDAGHFGAPVHANHSEQKSEHDRDANGRRGLLRIVRSSAYVLSEALRSTAWGPSDGKGFDSGGRAPEFLLFFQVSCRFR